MADEETAAPSNGAGEGAPVSTPAPAETQKPAASAREAVQRALSQPPPDSAQQKTAPATTPDKPEPKIDALGRAHRPDGTVAKKGEFEVPAKEEPKPEEVKAKRPLPNGFPREIEEKWLTADEVLQEQTEKRINDLLKGMEQHKGEAEKYKQSHEQFEQLKAFDDRAKQSGTTLTAALQNYTGIEDMLRQNFVGGIVQICRNLGAHPVALAQYILQIAQGQRPMPQQRPQPVQRQQQPPDIRAVVQEELHTITLKQELERVQTRPFFELLKPVMRQIAEAGDAQTVTDAYDKALSKHPELKAAVEAKANTAKETKPDLSQTQAKASLSVTGSPNAGANPSSRKPAGSAREAVRRALSNGLN